MDDRQLRAIRELLDEVYLDAQKSHSDGTVPCDLTLIFTALGSHTVKFENIDEKIAHIDTEMTNMNKKLDKLANNHAFAAGRGQGIAAVVGMMAGGAVTTIIAWLRGLL